MDKMPEFEKSKLLEIANDFNLVWNFPNCVGAIDGKHVAIKCPKNAGSLFYNYKVNIELHLIISKLCYNIKLNLQGFHSIVLMACCDAHYNFTYIDVGAYGSEGDANVFAASNIGKALVNDDLPFPENASVGSIKMPFYLVADDAFPLHKRIMKPFIKKRGACYLNQDERIFNYRLSRARRCIENAFGILRTKWQCLGRTLYCTPEKARKIIIACCYLHNFLRQRNSTTYCSPTYVDSLDEGGNIIEGDWRKLSNLDSALQLRSQSLGRYTNDAKSIREELKNFVNSEEGSISWQWKHV